MIPYIVHSSTYKKRLKHNPDGRIHRRHPWISFGKMTEAYHSRIERFGPTRFIHAGWNCRLSSWPQGGLVRLPWIAAVTTWTRNYTSHSCSPNCRRFPKLNWPSGCRKWKVHQAERKSILWNPTAPAS
jgi:hypothetical protein